MKVPNRLELSSAQHAPAYTQNIIIGLKYVAISIIWKGRGPYAHAGPTSPEAQSDQAISKSFSFCNQRPAAINGEMTVFVAKPWLDMSFLEY
jgi:hypothetical protein